MLSKEILNHLNKSIASLTSTRIFPVTYNQSEKHIYVRTEFRLRQMWTVYLHFALTFIFIFPTTLLGPVACFQNSEWTSAIVMPVIAVICIYYALILQSTFYIYRHEVCLFINKFLGFERSYGKLSRYSQTQYYLHFF